MGLRSHLQNVGIFEETFLVGRVSKNKIKRSSFLLFALLVFENSDTHGKKNQTGFLLGDGCYDRLDGWMNK